MMLEIWFRAAVFAGLGLGAGFASGLFGIGGGKVLRVFCNILLFVIAAYAISKLVR